MNDRSLSTVNRDARLAEVLDAYLAAQECGMPPDVDEFLARYPDLADELRECLASLAFIRRAEKLSIAGAVPTEGETSGGVLGDFRILREVGKGGMGVVYEAEQISLGRRVALKILPFAATMDPRHLQRFHNEARAAACLHHTNIVPVYFVGCERGVHFYAMQFIDGQSLEGFLRRLQYPDAATRTASFSPVGDRDYPEPISVAPDAVTAGESWAKAATQPAPRDAAHFRRVAEWGIAVAEALEHAHNLGIVHRDIKPANLLIDETGRLWVTDFGLARTVKDSRLTLTGDLLGTLRYMSPEQALAKHGLVDHRTDIYSLGVTLFELLTLRPAIDGLDREEVLKKIAFDEPAGARQLNGAVPVELETIVRKAMSKEPAERYAAAKEVADDLRRFLDHKPIRARRPSLFQRMKKWARRNTAIIWTAAVILVLAAAVLTAGSVWHMQEMQTKLAEIRRREREVRQHLYVQDIVLASRAMREGERERMRDLLDRHVPEGEQEDLRGFEWYYLKRRSRGLLHEAARVAAHEGHAYCVTYSPDGRTLASAGKDGMIRFWDARTLRPRGELRGGQGEVNEIAFTPDGKTLASAGDDGTVWLWDLASARQRAILRPKDWKGEMRDLAISPDGKVLAAGGKDGRIWSWDLATGRLKAEQNPGAGRIHDLTFAPDSRLLASATESGRVLLLDPATLQARGRFQYPYGPVYSVSFSHNGVTLAAGSSWGGRILLWDLTKQVLRIELRQHESSGTYSLSFSPDDTLLASAGNYGRMRLWDLRAGSLWSTAQGHAENIWCTAFAPDGEWLATADERGTVKLWRVLGDDSRRVIRVVSEVGTGIAVDWIAFSPEGQTLFARTTTGELGRWSTLSGQRAEPLETSRVWRAALAPASRLATVAADKKELRVQDLSGAAVQAYRHAQPISAIAIAQDSQHVAFGDDSPAVWMWEVGSDRPRELSRLPGVCKCLAFAPDGGTIAVAAAARVLLLDAARGQSLAVMSGHENEVRALAFSPDGRLLATAAADHTIWIWELPSGRERFCLWKHRMEVEAVAFSPDGKTLASGDRGGEVILWDVAGGQELMRLDEHIGGVLALAFSLDGKVLAAGKGAKVALWYGDGAQPNPEP